MCCSIRCQHVALTENIKTNMDNFKLCEPSQALLVGTSLKRFKFDPFWSSRGQYACKYRNSVETLAI